MMYTFYRRKGCFAAVLLFERESEREREKKKIDMTRDGDDDDAGIILL